MSFALSTPNRLADCSTGLNQVSLVVIDADVEHIPILIVGLHSRAEALADAYPFD